MKLQELSMIVGDVMPIVTTLLSAWLTRSRRTEQSSEARCPERAVEIADKRLDG